MLDHIIKYLKQLNGWELFGIAGGLIFGIFILAMLPAMIRDFKKYYRNRNKQQLIQSDNYDWMQFLYDATKRQGNSIKDKNVARCWDMFLECIKDVQDGIGNWGGIISLTDIAKYMTKV